MAGKHSEWLPWMMTTVLMTYLDYVHWTLNSILLIAQPVASRLCITLQNIKKKQKKNLLSLSLFIGHPKAYKNIGQSVKPIYRYITDLCIDTSEASRRREAPSERFSASPNTPPLPPPPPAGERVSPEAPPVAKIITLFGFISLQNQGLRVSPAGRLNSN